VKNRASANRAKPEAECCSLVAGADVFGSGTGNGKRGGVSSQRRENAAGALLAREAVANAGTQRIALNVDAELSAAT
jgi:hypothetical protein